MDHWLVEFAVPRSAMGLLSKDTKILGDTCLTKILFEEK